jgi:hypothetical protein
MNREVVRPIPQVQYFQAGRSFWQAHRRMSGTEPQNVNRFNAAWVLANDSRVNCLNLQRYGVMTTHTPGSCMEILQMPATSEFPCHSSCGWLV